MVSTFTTILENLITILTGGIVGVAEGVGKGVVALVTNIMFVTDSTTHAITDLNAFGYTIVTFAGVSLAIALSIRLYNYLISLGAKK